MKYSNIDFTNDVKVLGRVVSIAMDNKVAEAEQIFDTPFFYRGTKQNLFKINENKTGYDQYEINRLFRDKLWLMDDAGLIPSSSTGVITITNPTVFNSNITTKGNVSFNDGITIKGDITNTGGKINTPEIDATTAKLNSLEVRDNTDMNGNLNVSHKISANDIKCYNLDVKTKAVIEQLVVNGDLTFNKKVVFNQGFDVHGDSKFFDNVTIDGTLNLGGIGNVKQYLTTINNKISNLGDTINNEVLEIKDQISEQLDTTLIQNLFNNYYTKSEINQMLLNVDTGDTFTSDNYYTKLQIDQLIENITGGTGDTFNSNNYYSKSEIDSKILWQRNGTTLSPKNAGDNVSTSGKVYSGN